MVKNLKSFFNVGIDLINMFERQKNDSKIEEIAKRRGFFWQSSEIYGGLSGFYDYAHLGAAIKKKWENLWRGYFLGLDDNFYEIDCSNIMPEGVFKASGHLESFVDPIVKCKKCGNIERADQIIEEILKESFEGLTNSQIDEIIAKHNIRCPKCKGNFENAATLNMMFPLDIGTGKITRAYLRPETAQSVYVNFRREFECLRKKLPLGLAIIGKAYRNEISPRNVLLRMREFTQAELQIFFDPEKINEHPDFASVSNYKLRIKKHDSKTIEEVSCTNLLNTLPKFYVYYMAKIQQFYLNVLKIDRDKFRFRELSEEERAFYNKYHWDIELNISVGWKEVAGIHYRTDHDLAGHQKISSHDQTISVDGKKIIPHVLELSFGVDRNIFSLLDFGYKEEEDRVIFKLPRLVGPYDVAVFPLVNKDKLPEKAIEIKNLLKTMFSVFYDESGSVGRRYRRMDEIGVCCCVTIDNQTLEDDSVTIRDRDSMKQIRVKIDELCGVIYKFLNGENIEKLGELISRESKK